MRVLVRNVGGSQRKVQKWTLDVDNGESKHRGVLQTTESSPSICLYYRTFSLCVQNCTFLACRKSSVIYILPRAFKERFLRRSSLSSPTIINHLNVLRVFIEEAPNFNLNVSSAKYI